MQPSDFNPNNPNPNGNEMIREYSLFGDDGLFRTPLINVAFGIGTTSGSRSRGVIQNLNSHGSSVGINGFGAQTQSPTTPEEPAAPLGIGHGNGNWMQLTRGQQQQRQPMTVNVNGYGRVGSGSPLDQDRGLEQRRRVDFHTPESLGQNQAVRADNTDRYSTKVFIGGLPPDVSKEEIEFTFQRFGQPTVTWPGDQENRRFAGFAFLVFRSEESVHELVNEAEHRGSEFYFKVPSSSCPQGKDVQIRPWNQEDETFPPVNIVNDRAQWHYDPRNMAFLGGLPRSTTAAEIFHLFNRPFPDGDSVIFALIKVDPIHHYPKGSAKVLFKDFGSLIAALAEPELFFGPKLIEVKPYVAEDATCDLCEDPVPKTDRCNKCLKYFCRMCWDRAFCVGVYNNPPYIGPHVRVSRY